MSPDYFKQQAAFDAALSVGQTVEVRWTNSGHFYAGRGEIVRVNRSSVRVRLLEEVAAAFGSPYPVGREISAPRLLALDRWSVNNGVFSAKEEDQK